MRAAPCAARARASGAPPPPPPPPRRSAAREAPGGRGAGQGGRKKEERRWERWCGREVQGRGVRGGSVERKGSQGGKEEWAAAGAAAGASADAGAGQYRRYRAPSTLHCEAHLRYQSPRRLAGIHPAGAHQPSARRHHRQAPAAEGKLLIGACICSGGQAQSSPASRAGAGRRAGSAAGLAPPGRDKLETGSEGTQAAGVAALGSVLARGRELPAGREVRLTSGCGAAPPTPRE